MTTSSHSSAHQTVPPTGAALSDTAVTQPSLWFDDETVEPIGYTLTPAAQQLLVPGTRPTLTAVPALDDDTVDRDPRRAQVKAMYRGGLTPDSIAEQLELDVLLVRGWLDLSPMPTLTIRPAHPAGDVAAVTDTERFQARTVLHADVAWSFVVGVLATSAEWDERSVTIVLRDPVLARTVITALAGHLPLENAQTHVVLRLAAHSHGDRARTLWADVLGVDPAEIRTVRGRANANDEVLLRLVDPAVARLVGVFCEVAVTPAPIIVDVAF